MSDEIYLANSHRWLYDALTEVADLDLDDVRLGDDRRAADVIVYLEPPWPDDEAPDRIRTFRPRDVSRTFVFSQGDEPVAWAPGMYCSLPSSRSGGACVGGFYVPHHHRVAGGIGDDLEAVRARAPDLLWSFMGTVENHPIRQKLLGLDDPDGVVTDTRRFSQVVRWGWDSAHREEGRRAFQEYSSMLGRVSFVLCPRGRGAGSIRFFEALQVGRCPVVISDDWLAPPFVDWDTCSIRIPESSVEELPKILRQRAGDADALGRAARRVWEEFFSPEKQLQTLVRAAAAADVSIVGRWVLAGRALAGRAASRHTYREVKRAARGVASLPSSRLAGDTPQRL